MALLFSVRGAYADALMSGRKTVELRRRFGSLDAKGVTLFVYETAPTKAIVAKGRLSQVSEHRLDQLWLLAQRHGAITRADFDAYFLGLTSGFALHVTDIERLATPMPLVAMRSQLLLRPPQSYCRLSSEAEHEISQYGLPVPSRYELPHTRRGCQTCSRDTRPSLT